MICRAATELTKMAAALACGKSTQCVYEAVATKSKQFAARNSEMMSFQLAAMWHETYCGQVVGFTDWDLKKLMLFERSFSPAQWHPRALPVKFIEERANHNKISS